MRDAAAVWTAAHSEIWVCDAAESVMYPRDLVRRSLSYGPPDSHDNLGYLSVRVGMTAVLAVYKTHSLRGGGLADRCHATRFYLWSSAVVVQGCLGLPLAALSHCCGFHISFPWPWSIMYCSSSRRKRIGRSPAEIRQVSGRGILVPGCVRNHIAVTGRSCPICDCSATTTRRGASRPSQTPIVVCSFSPHRRNPQRRYVAGNRAAQWEACRLALSEFTSDVLHPSRV